MPRTIVPIGPYHPLQEEPEFFKLHVEGETVVGLDIELGYNHRGIEKISESKTYEQTVFVVERICGICSTSHPLACVQAVEDAGDIEVAKLCYHCGVAVKMEWGRYSSSANVADVYDAMVGFFRYDPDMFYWACSRDVMTTEIQWLRPVLFRADDANGGGGHAWVVYGYDKSTDPNRRFWMNMGWDGTATGWYTLDDITPNDWDFSEVQWHQTQIAPKSVVEFVGGPGGGDGTPGAPYVNVATAITYAPDGARLIFKAGSTNTFAGGSLVCDRPVTLTGHDVRIAHE